jgi:hypothetical protein
VQCIIKKYQGFKISGMSNMPLFARYKEYRTGGSRPVNLLRCPLISHKHTHTQIMSGELRIFPFGLNINC